MRPGGRSPNQPPREPLPVGFGSLWLTVVADLIGFGIIIPVLPLYARDFGASARTIGLLLSTYSLAQFVGAPVLGRLSDRFGRKPVLLAALVGSTLGNLFTALAGSVALLFVARAIDGLSGASVSVAQAAASDLADQRQRPRLFGLLGAAFGIGFVVGPAIGALAALGGRKLPFFVAAGLSAINVVMAAVRVPETRRRRSAAVGGPARVGGPAAVAARPAGGRLAQLVGMLRRGDRLGRLVVVSALGVLGFTALESTFSLAAKDRLGLGPGAVGVAFVAIGVVLSALQGGVTAKVIGRLGDLRTGEVGLWLNVVGFALLAPSWRWAGLACGTFVLVVGNGLLVPSLSTAVAAEAGEHERGAVFGVQQSASALARVVGPVAALSLYDRLGVGSPYVVAAVAMVGAWLLLRRVRAVREG